MSDTYFVSRSAFPVCSNFFKSDEQFGQYFLTDKECGALFSRDREERVYDPETGEHVKLDSAIIVNIAPDGEEPRLIKCDPSRKVVRAIVEKNLAEAARLEAAAVRKAAFLKQALRIRTDFDVDNRAALSELKAPAYDPETDPMGAFLVDELLDPESPLSLAIANA